MILHSNPENSSKEKQLSNWKGSMASSPMEVRASPKYRALKELSEAQETRRHIEHFLDDEKSAAINPPEARERLVKEAAFTWLNRLVAFNMIETVTSSARLYRRALNLTVFCGGLQKKEMRKTTKNMNRAIYPRIPLVKALGRKPTDIFFSGSVPN